MRIKAVIIFLLGAAAFPGTKDASGQSLNWQGQLSGWLAANDGRAERIQFGLRYIPTFSVKKNLENELGLDAEASFNAFGSVRIDHWNEVQGSRDLKLYRLWVRFSTPRFEARLGLQKINFGSALLLRPLMWFDRIDPNDPLQLTEGVSGLLAKYTFLNNAEIWLWGLYGNDSLKGWETIPSKRTSPEYGGRFGFPFLKGELALTYHHRRMDPQKSLIPLPPGETLTVPENRFGLDGKWDIGAGVWFEAVLSRQDFKYYPLRTQKYLNIGLDYTFVLGNGLHVLTEHLVAESSQKIFEAGETLKFSAVSLDYPLGLLDRIRAMVFYNWKTQDWYRFVTWQRTYDRWSIYLIGFWNPEEYRIYTSQQGTNLFGGKGIQLMIVFNH